MEKLLLLQLRDEFGPACLDRIVPGLACASIQASWTLGNCFLNLFLNMVDTLEGARLNRTLVLGAPIRCPR